MCIFYHFLKTINIYYYFKNGGKNCSYCRSGKGKILCAHLLSSGWWAWRCSRCSDFPTAHRWKRSRWPRTRSPRPRCGCLLAPAPSPQWCSADAREPRWAGETKHHRCCESSTRNKQRLALSHCGVRLAFPYQTLTPHGAAGRKSSLAAPSTKIDSNLIPGNGLELKETVSNFRCLKKCLYHKAKSQRTVIQGLNTAFWSQRYTYKMLTVVPD